MPEAKESKNATYTIDEFKLSRDYRKTEECHRIVGMIGFIIDKLPSHSMTKTAVDLSFLQGMLTDPTDE